MPTAKKTINKPIAIGEFTAWYYGLAGDYALLPTYFAHAQVLRALSRVLHKPVCALSLVPRGANGLESDRVLTDHDKFRVRHEKLRGRNADESLRFCDCCGDSDVKIVGVLREYSDDEVCMYCGWKTASVSYTHLTLPTILRV